jgi:hypothetical protein
MHSVPAIAVTRKTHFAGYPNLLMQIALPDRVQNSPLISRGFELNLVRDD